MADYTAKWRIQGENGMQTAFRSILGDAKSTSDRMSTMFRTAFAGVSAAAVVTGIGRAMRSAIEYGDEMQKAAAKTGIGAGAFSELAAAAKLSDIEVGSLSTALRKMQVAVSEAGSGAKEPLKAFHALGIEFATFRKLRADEQFELLADRINALKDPADKVRAAVALFGRAGADLLPMFSEGAEGIRKAREEVERLGGALTDEQIKKLADADDAIKRLTMTWQGFSRTVAATAAGPINTFLEKLQTMQNFQPSDFVRTLLAKGPLASWSDLADTVKNRMPAPPQAAEWGGLNSDLMGRTSTSKAPPGFGGDSGKGGAKIWGEDIAITAQRITVSATEALYAEMDEATKTAMQKQLDAWYAFEVQIQQLVDSGRITQAEANARTVERIDQELEPIKITAERLFPKPEQAKLNAFAEQAARNVQDSFARFLFDPFEGGLKGMLAGFADMLRQMLAQLAAQELLRGFFSWGAGLGGGVGSFFSSMGAAAAGSRAVGGDVKSGSAYWVGERGRRELFVPGVSGTVLPMDRLAGAGGPTIHITNNVSVTGETDLQRALPVILARSNQQAVQQAKSEIRNDLKRFGRVR